MKISKFQVDKMIRQVFVLLFAGLLAVQVSSRKIKSLRTREFNINPRDLMDDAKQQIATLRGIVHGSIFEAQGDFGTLGMQFGSYSDNILQVGQLDIDQEHETVTGQITVIRDLGYTADVDVSSCVDIREQVINRLPDEYKGHITECIFTTDAEVTRIIQDANYFVDVYTNQVDNLEFQLGLCAADSIICISSIVSQIELAMTQLPQSIRVEVDRASELVETQKTSVRDCSNTRVAEYSSESNSILNDISACVNRLLA